MKNFLLEQQQKDEKIAISNQFIGSKPEARELKRALAVKMALQGTPYAKITELVWMHKTCITTWKQKFEAEGIEGIRLGYRGATCYLTPEQRAEVITWLRRRNYWNIDELFSYLDEYYQVIYKSKQSYYQLLSEAKISWKKSQKSNPKHDERLIQDKLDSPHLHSRLLLATRGVFKGCPIYPEIVVDPELLKKKREEIQDFVRRNSDEIEDGRLIVLFVDECHLLGDDVCGYVWGRTDMRIEIPIKNIKSRQTYYGALNYQTQEFILREYSSGDSSNTVKEIQELQNLHPAKRIALIWDGASYHKSDEIKEFLASVNQSQSPEQWHITCILFAPNAPEQNPVEDVWLQAKNFLRKFGPLCKSFAVVKWLFKFETNHQKFNFPKLHQYAACSNLN